jgi:hypothetical protein
MFPLPHCFLFRHTTKTQNDQTLQIVDQTTKIQRT